MEGDLLFRCLSYLFKCVLSMLLFALSCYYLLLFHSVFWCPFPYYLDGAVEQLW
jgi:hypothetical protein